MLSLSTIMFSQALSSNAFNVRSCLKTRDHISQPYKATGIIVLHQPTSSTGNRQLQFQFYKLLRPALLWILRSVEW
jgi:hypothetical protein